MAARSAARKTRPRRYRVPIRNRQELERVAHTVVSGLMTVEEAEGIYDVSRYELANAIGSLVYGRTARVGRSDETDPEDWSTLLDDGEVDDTDVYQKKAPPVPRVRRKTPKRGIVKARPNKEGVNAAVHARTKRKLIKERIARALEKAPKRRLVIRKIED